MAEKNYAFKTRTRSRPTGDASGLTRERRSPARGALGCGALGLGDSLAQGSWRSRTQPEEVDTTCPGPGGQGRRQPWVPTDQQWPCPAARPLTCSPGRPDELGAERAQQGRAWTGGPGARAPGEGTPTLVVQPLQAGQVAQHRHAVAVGVGPAARVLGQPQHAQVRQALQVAQLGQAGDAVAPQVQLAQLPAPAHGLQGRHAVDAAETRGAPVCTTPRSRETEARGLRVRVAPSPAVQARARAGRAARAPARRPRKAQRTNRAASRLIRKGSHGSCAGPGPVPEPSELPTGGPPCGV